MEETRTATFWARPPLMLPPGADRMTASFAAYDPRKLHPYQRRPFKAWIPDVVHGGPVFAGQDFEVIGRVATSNLIRPISPRLGEWLVQLAPITVDDGLIYCRVTARLARRPFPGGQYRVARGTVIAVGVVQLVNGHFENISYMACSAVGSPYGGLGQFTRFVESAGIDVARIYRRARSVRELDALWRAEVARALRDNPALSRLIPLRHRGQEAAVLARASIN